MQLHMRVHQAGVAAAVPAASCSGAGLTILVCCIVNAGEKGRTLFSDAHWAIFCSIV